MDFKHSCFWWSVIKQFHSHFFVYFLSSLWRLLLLVGISCFHSRVDRIYFVYMICSNHLRLSIVLYGFIQCPVSDHNSALCLPLSSARSANEPSFAAKLASNEKTSWMLNLRNSAYTRHPSWNAIKKVLHKTETRPNVVICFAWQPAASIRYCAVSLCLSEQTTSLVTESAKA